MNTKYELTSETTTAPDGTTLYRIRALANFGTITAGMLGGFIASEANLSVSGTAWVFDSAQVSGSARVTDSARVFGTARVFGSAQVSGTAWVTEILPVATRSDGHTFLITKDKDDNLVIIAGCRYFTIEQAREHWSQTRGGTPLGDESLAIVDHLERMATIRGWRKGGRP